MGTKATHNPDEVFKAYLGFIKQGFSRTNAAKKCGVGRSYPERCFTAIQKAEIDQEYHTRSYKSGTNRPNG